MRLGSLPHQLRPRGTSYTGMRRRRRCRRRAARGGAIYLDRGALLSEGDVVEWVHLSRRGTYAVATALIAAASASSTPTMSASSPPTPALASTPHPHPELSTQPAPATLKITITLDPPTNSPTPTRILILTLSRLPPPPPSAPRGGARLPVCAVPPPPHRLLWGCLHQNSIHNTVWRCYVTFTAHLEARWRALPRLRCGNRFCAPGVYLA